MKKSMLFIAAAAALVMGTACQQDDPVKDNIEETGSITIGLEGQFTTRAAVTTANDWETQLNKVEILVFDATGALTTYHDFTAAEITAKKATTDKIKKGTYTVCVVANGGSLSLNSVSTLTALQDKEIAFATYNSRTAASGMIMYGKTASVNCNAENTACAVTISRKVARVCLKSITNGAVAALGAITPKAVFLSNVNTKEYIEKSFTGAAADFCNQYGRSSAYTLAAKIDGSTNVATNPTLTYQALSGTVATGATSSYGYTYGVYTYANANADKNDLDLTSALPTYAPAGCRLVVLATFNGTDYYYPVAIPDVAANKTYDVVLTIAGKGLDDPQGDITSLEKGSIAVTITVADWIDGGELTGDY